MGADEGERLQRLSALCKASPAAVSVMWPSPDEALQARILNAGAVQVLAKPISPADLAASIGRWFAQAAHADEVSAPAGVTAC